MSEVLLHEGFKTPHMRVVLDHNCIRNSPKIIFCWAGWHLKSGMYRGTSLKRNRPPLGSFNRPMRMVLGWS